MLNIIADLSVEVNFNSNVRKSKCSEGFVLGRIRVIFEKKVTVSQKTAEARGLDGATLSADLRRGLNALQRTGAIHGFELRSFHHIHHATKKISTDFSIEIFSEYLYIPVCELSGEVLLRCRSWLCDG